DLGELIRRQDGLGWERGELRALLLDRPRVRAGLLDQGRHDAANGLVREVPLARELERRQPVAFGDRPHAGEALPAGLDPAVGPERAVIARAELVARRDVAVE